VKGRFRFFGKRKEGITLINPNQIDDRTSDGVNLLITILMRFPQIGTVHYDPKNRTLRMTFILSSSMSDDEFAPIMKKAVDCLSAYHRLVNRKPSMLLLDYKSSLPFSIFSITRDLFSVTRGEISLIINLLSEEFPDHLVIENPIGLEMQEDVGMADEWIDSMIENVRQQRSKKRLTAFREDGRVLVFNK
jgi:hypothetical protein